MNPIKSSLRKDINFKIKSMSILEQNKQSEYIQNKFLQSSYFKNASTLSIYVSFTGEVNTQKIIETCFQENKNVFVPLIENNNPMKMYQIYSMADLEPIQVFKSIQILQPTNPHNRNEIMNMNSLDLIVLPGVAFDKNGSRLGRGKGYYDSFINKAKNKFLNIKTVGLAFSEQILSCNIIPMDKTDEYIDNVITYDKE